jgi:hypothetical protein
LLALPATRGGEHVVLVVGATRENRAETLSSLRAAFLIGGADRLVLAALGGYLLAARPFGRSSREATRARHLGPARDSLDERLPVPPATTTSSPGLGETLNAMLARLEDGSSGSAGSSPTRATSCGRRSRF